MTTSSPAGSPDSLAHALRELRAQAPLVHNITNYVAMTTAANVLLAAGASPAMLHAVEEAPEFVQLSRVLSINIGTLSAPWVESMLATTAAAQDAGIPWVLDPVAVGATRYRRDVGKQLLANRPTVIRGNASEILALAGFDASGKGADASDSVSQAIAAAQQLTRHADIVVVTGAVDYVTDGQQAFEIHNGDAMMTKVTALGCALTALLAGFVGCQPTSPLTATIAALAYYGLAGEAAATEVAGPGSFYVAFLDQLTTLSPEQLMSAADVRVADD